MSSRPLMPFQIAARIPLPKNYSRGEHRPQAKLTAAQVRAIRMNHAKKERLIRALEARFSAAALAREYGVSKDTVQKILTFKAWTHV